MGSKLVIVRHGNTFLPGQIPTRVGGRTDLPLVETHRASSAGKYLKEHGIMPDRFFSAPLKRTRETARVIMDELKNNSVLNEAEMFREIDYGPDENKTEEEVLLRLGSGVIEDGRKIIDKWNESAIVPDGWIVNVEGIIGSWKKFADEIPEGSTTLLCTSNGIIRFAPHILDIDFSEFTSANDLKVATGSISMFEKKDGIWKCILWNEKPYKIYK